MYRGLSNFALHVNSGPGTQDIRDVTVWVEEGKLLRPLSANASIYNSDTAVDALARSTPTVSSSFAPYIFLDTILDSTNGIGKYASLRSVYVVQLAQSKQFCVRNKFFMDGLIGDARAWR